MEIRWNAEGTNETEWGTESWIESGSGRRKMENRGNGGRVRTTVNFREYMCIGVKEYIRDKGYSVGYFGE